MTDLSASSLRRHTRASWLAVRTFRQVPRMIGRTDAGAPTFEIRSVGLVLQDEMRRRLGLIGERLVHETERHNRRLDAVEGQLLEAQEGIARVMERMDRDVGSSETRVEEQLNDRLDRLAERAARRGKGEDVRLSALEAAIDRLAGRVTELGDTLGVELATSRLEALGHEMSQLGDLQAVLDVGLGQLRSRIDELTEVTRTLALGQAAVDAQLQTLTDVKRPTGDRRRTLGQRGEPAETPAEHTADRAPTVGHGDLEDKQLKAQLAMLEHMTDVGPAASADTSGLGSLDDDVRALAEHLAGHDEALTRLSRSVERLRRGGPTQRVAPRATSHRSSSS